jgi:predicted Zn-dependent protease
MGKIADVLQARGELEEALRIRREEELPVYERLGDVDGIAHVHWAMAQIWLRQKKLKEAFEALAKSYDLNLKLGRLDGICMVGLDLGQLLLGAGKKKEAATILRRSRDGFQKLGRAELARQVDELMKQAGLDSAEGGA